MNVLECIGCIACVVACVGAVLLGIVIYNNYFRGGPPQVPIELEVRTTADEKCDEYNLQICQIVALEQSNQPAEKVDAIIGGRYANEGQFPHQALIQFTKKNNRKGVSCGGSLISELFILTAAHCIKQAGDYAGIKVILGTVFGFSEKYPAEVYGVREISVHPNYTEKRPIDDIALLKLDRTVDFSKTVRPICLNTKYDSNRYTKPVALGWGTQTGATNPRLQAVRLRIDEKPDSVCGKNLKRYGADSQRIICTFNSENDNSAYEGDFGGPLQISRKGCADQKTTFYEVIGVFSRYEQLVEDEREAGRYNFFTKVERYLKWIEDIVWS